MKTKTIEIFSYYPEMRVVNIHTLPKGKGCRYLECIHGPDGTFIAKRWRRAMKCDKGGVLVDFEP